MNIVILAFTFVALLASCGGKDAHTLSEAERILPENPDSALSILGRVNPDNLRRKVDRAYHALLTTEARYKSGLDETDDSLISIATDYYNLKDNDIRRARAFYQKGIIECNAGEYGDALISLMNAEETASSIGDTVRLALIHRGMGDAFDLMTNPKTAIGYYRKSYDEFKSINDSVYTPWALLDVARVNYNATNYAETIHITMELLSTIDNNTSILRAKAFSLLGRSYESLNNNDKAVYYLSRLHGEYPDEMTHKDWNSLGIASLKLGNIKFALECEDSAKTLSDSQVVLSYYIADANKDYDLSLQILKNEINDFNCLTLEKFSRNTEKILLEQFSLSRKKAILEKKQKTLIFIVILLTIAVICSLAWIYFKKRFRKLSTDNIGLAKINDELTIKKNQLEKNQEENDKLILSIKEIIRQQEHDIETYRQTIDSLSNDKAHLLDNITTLELDNEQKLSNIDLITKEIKEREEIIDELNVKLVETQSTLNERNKAISETREKLKDSMSSRFDIFDELVKIYYNVGDTPLPKNAILNKFTSIIDSIRKDKNVIREYEEAVNTHLDNLMQKFKTDFPNLKDSEYTLYLFLVLGFSPKSISIFLNITTDNFYNRKSYLIKKIKSNSLPTLENYLSFI